MAPNPRLYTVGCALAKAVPDPEHVTAIRGAVSRVHACTYHATDLLNLYVRERLENHDGTGLEDIFTQNWLHNAFKAVSTVKGGGRRATVDPLVQAVFDEHMGGTLTLTARDQLDQALRYECKNLEAVGKTNVWMHFRKRVLAYARTAHALEEHAYEALSKAERGARKLAIMQAADDVCRIPTEGRRSPQPYHAWVDAARARLGIDAAVGDDWDGKPLLYHLKARPHRFLKAMHAMGTAQHAAGRSVGALFPLRRSHVPRHMRFDQRVLDTLLGLRALGAVARAKKAASPDPSASASGRAPKRKRDDTGLRAEKATVFGRVLDLRRAGVHRRRHFAFAFTTDGVSLHLQMERSDRAAKGGKAAVPAPPLLTRGIHSIDALKAAARSAEGLHVVGIDPGKIELLVAVDTDDPMRAAVVRYTLAQRRRDMRTRQYAHEGARGKPAAVALAEEQLSTLSSKAPKLAEYAAFSAKRRQLLREREEIASFYADLGFRERRRKGRIKAQQSEARLVARLGGMHAAGDTRKLVLAYGAWGLVAGRPGRPGNKGNPPAVGAGLMKRLALHFVVAPTPEHHTSKTCVKCRGPCGAHPTLKTKANKDIRGLRACQREGCGLLQNRDRMGATNIGLQFQRLVRDQPPLRPMSAEELEFHRLAACVECAP